ncbi:MAG: MATE family efflux transporter [Bacteroidia bacterium]|nr:MATE family efflux transporter [Bacteroidia bacterium]
MNSFFSRYQTHFRETLKLTWPVVIGQLGHIGISLADNTMIGNLGYKYLAAASIANGFFFLILVPGMGLSMATTPLVAEAVTDKEACKNLFNQSFWVNFFASLVLAALCWSGVYLVPFLDQPAEIVPMVGSYLKILAVSIIPSMVFLTYKQFIEGLSQMRPAMFIMVSVVLANVGLNYLLIYGKFGFPELGLDGAGWATLISRIYGMLALGAFVIFSPRFKEYKPWPYISNIGYSLAKKILSIGIPSSLQYFFEVGAFTASALLAGLIGSKALAAHQLAIHLSSITYSIALGISSAAAIRVANAKGEQNLIGMRMAGFSSVFLGILFMCCCAIIFVLGRNLIPELYLSDPEVLQITAILLLIAALFQISDGVQAITIGALRGLTDVKIPAVMTFIAYWVLGLPIGWILGILLDWGVEGIWVGISLGLTFSAIFLVLRFRYMTRKANILA